MILGSARVEDVDRFVDVFSTKGAEKRKEHGSKSAIVFRDPEDRDRVWAVFDWDEQGWQRFLADPDAAAIFQDAGLNAPPQHAELIGEYDA